MNSVLNLQIASENAVLQTRKEWKNAVKQALNLQLPLHPDPPKNWDSLIALKTILNQTEKTARILDAGAELYSMILPWLSSYGYQNLIGINLVFDEPIKQDNILYEYGDLTQTRYESDFFDGITSLSVIEHGVNLRSYFQEMSRLLKPGGLLITSTDYYPEPINTQGKIAFGVPVHVFSKPEIEELLKLASEFNLVLTSSLNLNSTEKTISWLDLQYTFVIFTLKKIN